MEVNCESLSVFGATLANEGTCPTTEEKVVSPQVVRDVLSLMHSCGMYNYSGQFAFKVRFRYITCHVTFSQRLGYQPKVEYLVPLSLLFPG